MDWFGWLVLGFALLVGEVVFSASFFLLFFGIGALSLGVIVALGGSFAPWLEWVVFTGLSVTLLVLFRKGLRARIGGGVRGADTDSLVGVRGKALGEIEPGGRGRGEFRGSSWEIRNVGSHALAAGDECTVEAVQGLSLDVR